MSFLRRQRLRRRRQLSACAALVVYLAAALAPPARAGPALLYEPATGIVLFADDPDHFWFPASLTKLMTAYLTFEEIASGRLTSASKLILSRYARSQPATRVGLRFGIDVSIDTAVRALIIRSANDFAVALAETIAGSEQAFVARMNATALRLGMNRTFFSNPHGLPDSIMVTSARDMALLTNAILKDFPMRADVFSNTEVSIRRFTMRTHNGLLRTFDGADGMKTGFTCSSGYNIVVSATRNGRRLVAVVLGELTGAARSRRAAELLDYGFEIYEWKKLFNAPVLGDLALQPAAPVAPPDLRRKTRTWKCGNGRRSRRRGRRR